MDPETWTVEEVAKYLEDNNFKEYRKLFYEENKIDGKHLLYLTEDDLKKQPLKIATFGDRRRLWFLIDNLQEEKRLDEQRMRNEIDSQIYSKVSKYVNIDQASSLSGWSSLSAFDSNASSCTVATSLKVQKRKFGLALLYIFVSHVFAGYSVTYAQEHLPDKKKYPPLPDVFLDNLPQIPWAYHVTEWSIIVLSIIGLSLLMVHKHRFRILQRLLVVTATIYFLRSLCVMSTAIPMPQMNYECERLDFTSGWERFKYTAKIYVAIGLKTNGIKTCGDYVFSGHTAIITLLVLSINEYSPAYVYLHKLNWIIGFFGVFFILLAHGHYTLDIVLAFAISAGIFHAYHTFANNVSLMKKDKFRMKISFPIFYYFEHDMVGSIPSEFECPFRGCDMMEQLYLQTKCTLCNFCSNKSTMRE